MLKGEALPVDEYDALKAKGKLLGQAAGSLAYTPQGRTEITSLLSDIKKRIKDISPGGLFGKREPKDDQVIYEIDSGLLTSANPELNKPRLELKRARMLVNGMNPVLSEDGMRQHGFSEQVFIKGIKDGWQEVFDQSSFRNEAVTPDYLTKTQPGAELRPARKIK